MLTFLCSGLELGSDLAGTLLTDFITMYQNEATIEPIISSLAGSLVNALVNLGPGTCLLETDLALIEEFLTQVPDL